MTDDAAAPICLARPLPGPGDDRAGGCAAARGVDGRPLHAAALKFFWGPMDCGKSTMALQMNYNHARQGRRGLVTTRIDRSLGPQVTTRIGLAHSAVEVTDELDLRDLVRDAWAEGVRVDYLICDEASFYNLAHIEQMADLVDNFDVDVYAFGLATDFRTRLFPASRRLFEVSDQLVRLQVEVLCWCGRPGLLNARIEGGVVAREGAQFVVADIGGPDTADAEPADVRYQVLCRRHHRAGDLGPAARQPDQLRLV